jgi:hypothetical protein
MPTYQKREIASRKMSTLEAMVTAGDNLTDRTSPLPRFVENNLEGCMSDLMHLWLAQRDPEFYQRLVGQEL